jgi:hypothetical protein
MFTMAEKGARSLPVQPLDVEACNFTCPRRGARLVTPLCSTFLGDENHQMPGGAPDRSPEWSG